jgi:hypothetical protein
MGIGRTSVDRDRFIDHTASRPRSIVAKPISMPTVERAGFNVNRKKETNSCHLASDVAARCRSLS